VDANDVQLVITGGNDSGTELFQVYDVTFAESAANPDSDGDGMTDAYELANGLNPGSAADKFTDLDHDGVSNYDEFIAGTAANNPSSALKFTTVNQAGNTYTLNIATVPGKTYQAEASTNLQGASWAPLGSPIIATGSQSTLNVTTPAGPRYFLRVTVH
jgi:hypothetical protein